MNDINIAIVAVGMIILLLIMVNLATRFTDLVNNWRQNYTDEYKKFIRSKRCPNCLATIKKEKKEFVNNLGERIDDVSMFKISRGGKNAYLRCYNCGHNITVDKDMYRKNIEKKYTGLEGRPEKQPIVEIVSLVQEKREKVIAEKVKVPQGVVITIKRSRTIDHTLSVNWREANTIKGEMGLRQLVSIAIQKEVERSQGRIYRKSETIEYEVELNGEKGTLYELAWFDVWLSGDSEVLQGDVNVSFPFKFRDRSELVVSIIE